MEFLNSIISQSMVRNTGWTLIHCLWQATAVAIVLSIVLRLMRSRSANSRYITGCAALLITVASAFITFAVIGGEDTTSITAKISAPEIVVDNTVIAKMPSKIVTENIPVNTHLALAEDKPANTAMGYIVGGWLIGVLAVSFWYLGGYVQLNTLRWRTVKPVSEHYESVKQRLAESAAVKKNIRLYESAIVQVPVVIGHIRPVILLPLSILSGMAASDIESILAHELAHIRRHDYLVNMLQSLVEILGFYNPGIWWISAKIKSERENCCDDMASEITGSRVQYAKALLRLAEIRQSEYPRAVAASGGDLLYRISRLVGRDVADKSRPGWLPSILAVAIAVLSIYSTVAAADASTDASSGKKADTQLVSKPKVEKQFSEKYVQKMQKLVENFFDNNFRDVTARKTILWGHPTVDKRGNKSIRYQYEATIWDKDKTIIDQVFTFNRHNKFVSVEDYDDYLLTNSDAKFYAYKVDKKVSDFPEEEDFSTPQSAYAAINRVMASGETAGWVRVSRSKLKISLEKDAKNKKSQIEPSWAKTVRSAQIIEVLVKGHIALVLAEFPQDEITVRNPIDARYLQWEKGKWLNKGEDRFDDIRRARLKFARNYKVETNLVNKLEYHEAGYQAVEKEEKSIKAPEPVKPSHF